MAKKGSYEDPYLYTTYQSMSQNQTWQGGWVDRSDEVVYYTANGNEEKNNANGLLGSEDNPFSSYAYYEMAADNTWVGGYAMIDGDCVYIPAQNEFGEGCGCGCDEGCGCGCGCGNGYGLVSGTAFYRLDVDAPTWAPSTIVHISWGTGTFLHGDEPSLEVEIVYGFEFQFVYSWENAYRVHIYSEYVRPYHFFYNIPHNYRR